MDMQPDSAVVKQKAFADRGEAILMRLCERPAPEWRHKVFVSYVVAMVLMFLVPVPRIPLAEATHVDKLVHFGVFLGFALLFDIDRHWRVWWTFLVAVAFAGAIELVQSLLPYREGDWWDFIAGGAGAGLRAVIVLLIEKQVSRLAAKPLQSGLETKEQTARPKSGTRGD